MNTGLNQYQLRLVEMPISDRFAFVHFLGLYADADAPVKPCRNTNDNPRKFSDWVFDSVAQTNGFECHNVCSFLPCTGS